MTLPLTESESFDTVLAGQYALEREVGRGGMGIVYLARDLKLDRLVAIKTLPPHLAADPTVRERFIREARTAAKLTHPNIVPIHRADELGGRVFFVMGFVEGDSLAQRIRDQSRVSPLEVVRVLRDVASALAYAHARGVVHRDVKAENILIDAVTGRALVTDFGIARLAEASPLTSTGQVLGTVHYLSPEQVSGEAVDARSDLYSLGVVGFFALAGRFPFEAELASAVLVAHVTKAPPPLLSMAPDVPPALGVIVDRCLAKDAARRFQSGGELVDALNAIEPEIARSSTAPDRIPVASAPIVADTEAQAIWERAAELQAATGVHPRSAPLVRERDVASDGARTSGYDVSDVRAAAAEAGIDARYVEHALAEHGLLQSAPPGSSAGALTAIRDRSLPRSPFIGGHKELEFEVVLEGEIPEHDFDLLVDLIRRGVGEVGAVSSVGRSFTWHTLGQNRKVQVSVLPRGGKTTVRVSENMKHTMDGVYGAAVGAGGFGVGGILFGIAMGNHLGVLAVAAFPVAATVGYTVARTIFSNLSRTRATVLRRLAEDIAALARESIDSARARIEG